MNRRDFIIGSVVGAAAVSLGAAGAAALSGATGPVSYFVQVMAGDDAERVHEILGWKKHQLECGYPIKRDEDSLIPVADRNAPPEFSGRIVPSRRYVEIHAFPDGSSTTQEVVVLETKIGNVTHSREPIRSYKVTREASDTFTFTT